MLKVSEKYKQYWVNQDKIFKNAVDQASDNVSAKMRRPFMGSNALKEKYCKFDLFTDKLIGL